MFERFCEVRERGKADFLIVLERPDCSTRSRRRPIPYVVLAGDVAGMRVGQTSDEERDFYRGAHAVLVCSVASAVWLYESYGVQARWVPGFAPADEIDFERPEPIPRTCVYVGGLVPRSARDGRYGYKALHEVFEAVQDAGYEMHAYCTTSTRDYDGVVWHDPVPASLLYREIARYSVGLQAWSHHGTSAARRYAQAAWPNKASDYTAAGIPTLGYNTPIDFSGVGANIASLADMRQGLDEAGAVTVTEAQRRAVTIDRYACVFERIVATVPETPRASYEPPERKDETMGRTVVIDRRLYRTDPVTGIRSLAHPKGARVPIEEYRRLTGVKEKKPTSRKEIMDELRRRGIKFRVTSKTEDLRALL